MMTHHPKHAADPGLSSPFSAWQREVEGVVRQSFHLTADLLIDALDQTARVLRRSEQLGEQVLDLLRKIEVQRQDFRHSTKAVLQETIHDSVEICSEVIQGVVQVMHAALDEAAEIGRRSERLGGHVRDSLQDLPNPFKNRSARKSQGKEPTIIPISIQDN